MKAYWFVILKKKIKKNPMHLLTWSILLYFFLLPFNTFGFPLPIVGYFVKYTELALILVFGIGVYIYRKRLLTLQKAQWLYGFLFLQAVAQFISLFNTRNPFIGLDVAIAVASYSVLVFVIVNVIHSQTTLEWVLAAMGIIVAGISVVVYWQSLTSSSLRGVEYHPTYSSESILGNGVPHYIAYFLIMYGAGLIYLFMRPVQKRWVKGFLFLAAIVWLHAILLTSVKTAHVVALLLLLLLVALSYGQRGRAAALLGIYVVLFFLRWHVVPIKNAFLLAQHKVSGYMLALEDRFSAPSQPLSLTQPIRGTLPTPSGAPESSSSPLPAETPSSPPELPPAIPQPESESENVPVPPSLPEPQLIDQYSEENRVKNRWGNSQLSDSQKIRKRGIAVALLMGAESPFTGIGVGQTNLASFEEYTLKVRAKAHEEPKSFLHKYIFTDEEIKAAPADKGVFNIFMNAWAETGLFGLIAIVGILLIVFFKGVHALWHIRHVPGMQPIRILFSLFVGIVLYHQTIYLWVHPWLWTIIGLTYAAAAVSLNNHENIKT